MLCHYFTLFDERKASKAARKKETFFGEKARKKREWRKRRRKGGKRTPIFCRWRLLLSDESCFFLNFFRESLSETTKRLFFFEKEGIKALVFSSLMGLIYSEDFLKKRMIYLKKNHGNLEDVLLDEEVFKKKYLSTWDLWERKEDYDEFLH